MKKMCLTTLLLVLFATTAFSRPLEIVTTSYPPYVYLDNDKIKGFNVVLLKEIFRRMNLDISIEILPWARALHKIETGGADAMFPLFKTKDREVYTDYSDAFTTEDTALFVLGNSPVQWNGNLNEMTVYKFGRVRGYSSGSKIDDLIENGTVKIEEVTTTMQNVKKLLSGRIDILVETKYVALHELQEMGRSEDVRMLAIVQENLSYLGFSKKRHHLPTITRFNSVLKKMKEDGSYQKIIDNYFGK